MQNAASVKDENGNLHSAKVIWGASEKPHLGDSIELVIIATRFMDDVADNPGVMKGIIPPMTVPVHIEEEKSPEGPVLEPVAVRKPTTVLQPKSTVAEARPTLSRRNARYDSIPAMLNTPAYQRRNVQFIVDMTTTSKETLKDESEITTAKPSESSLFD